MRLAYMRFCVHFGRRYVPADPITVVTYAVFLCRSLKPSSIPSYLNIIRLIHLDAGYPDPLHDNFALACVSLMIKYSETRLKAGFSKSNTVTNN